MDTEDRDHFKTIASRPAEPPQNLPSLPNVGSSNLLPDPAYCLKRAEILLSCYRKDEVHNPEIYSASVASILAEWSPAVVDYVTDPRTGIASDLKWLPSVAEVRNACLRAQTRLDALAKPKAVFSREPKKPLNLIPGQETYAMFLERGGVRPQGRFEL